MTEAAEYTIRLFDQGEARERLRSATRIILDAEAAYEKAVERAADAQAVYRNELAEAFKRYRDEGDPITSAEITAKAEVAIHERERDYSAGMLRLAAERLEDARDSRRSLWRLIEWSARKDAPPMGTAPVRDERIPGETWPN